MIAQEGGRSAGAEPSGRHDDRPDERFGRRWRIRHQRDFDAVFASRKVVSDDLLILHLAKTEHNHLRLGLSIGKKNGPAHERNRLKRLCREAFRRQCRQYAIGADLVLRIRPGQSLDYHDLSERLSRLIPRGLRRLTS